MYILFLIDDVASLVTLGLKSILAVVIGLSIIVIYFLKKKNSNGHLPIAIFL